MVEILKVLDFGGDLWKNLEKSGKIWKNLEKSGTTEARQNL
jgi:plasmid maintenance system antidote protein VapI